MTTTKRLMGADLFRLRQMIHLKAVDLADDIYMDVERVLQIEKGEGPKPTFLEIATMFHALRKAKNRQVLYAGDDAAWWRTGEAPHAQT